MGSRYRCRVSPSGVPGCEGTGDGDGPTGATGATGPTGSGTGGTGEAGGCAGFVSQTLFVDHSTTTAEDDQTGEFCTPYATLQQALDVTDELVVWTILAAPGVYDEDLIVPARTRTRISPWGDTTARFGSSWIEESGSLLFLGPPDLSSPRGISWTSPGPAPAAGERPFFGFQGFVSDGIVVSDGGDAAAENTLYVWEFVGAGGVDASGHAAGDLNIEIENASITGPIVSAATNIVQTRFPLAEVQTIELASASRLVDLDTDATPDQALVMVKSVEDHFQLDKTPLAATLAAADGITIVVSGTNPAHVWIRKMIRSLNWEHQAAWFISPGPGNDENAGDTALVPIQTLAELTRRLNGSGGTATINQNTLVTFANGSPGAINLDVHIGDTFFFTFQGAISSTAASAIDAVTATVPSTNTRGAITDAATVFVDQTRLRLTSGASTGALAWVTRVIAAGNANVSRWALVNPQLSTFPTLVEPAAGTTFVVDSLATTINRIDIRVRGNGRMIIRDMNITSQEAHRITQDQTLQAGVYIYGCNVQTADFFGSNGMLMSCQILGLAAQRSALFVRASVMIGNLVGSVVSVNEGGHIAFSRGCQFNQCGLLCQHGGSVNWTAGVNGDCGWVDCVNESAISINGGSFADSEDPLIELWGADNVITTAAIIIRGTGGFSYLTTPHIPGGLVDCQIGGNSVAYAGLPFFDAAHGCGLVTRPL